MAIDLVRGRQILYETEDYYLLGADIDSTPGYLTLEARSGLDRNKWVSRLIKFLDREVGEERYSANAELVGSDQTIPIIWALNNKYSYLFKDGMVLVSPSLVRVELNESHQNLLNVAAQLSKMAVNTRKPTLVWTERELFGIG